MSFKNEPNQLSVDHLFTSPKLVVTEGVTTATGQIHFEDQFFVRTDDDCQETIIREATLHVHISLDTPLEPESQVEVYFCNTLLCYVWSWTNDTGYLRITADKFDGAGIKESTDRPWYVFDNNDRAEVTSTWKLPNAEDPLLINESVNCQNDAVCDGLDYDRHALRNYGTAAFSQNFVGGSQYNFYENVYGEEDTDVGEYGFPDLGAKWSMGIYFRTTAYDRWNPTIGASSETVWADVRTDPMTMNERIQHYHQHKFENCRGYTYDPTAQLMAKVEESSSDSSPMYLGASFGAIAVIAATAFLIRRNKYRTSSDDFLRVNEPLI